MERAKVTFEDPKSGQQIIINFSHDVKKQTIDYKVSFIPDIQEKEQKLGIIGFLADVLLNNLKSE